MNRQLCGILSVIALLAAGAMRCSTDVAGGSQVGNPAVVAGMIVDTTGVAAVGVEVHLAPVDFHMCAPSSLGLKPLPMTVNAGVSQVPEPLTTHTDVHGRYSFQGIDGGAHVLFAFDSVGRTMLLAADIVVDADSLWLGIDTLRAPGVVVVQVPDSVLIQGALLLVTGTVLGCRTDTAGMYALDVPAGTIAVEYYSVAGDSVITRGPNVQGVEVAPHDTVRLFANEVTTPVVTGKAPLGTYDVSYAFAVNGARSSWESALEYRFDWGRGDTSLWSSDSVVAHQWMSSTSQSNPDTIAVRAQARVRDDPLAVSTWSEPCSLILSSQPLLLRPRMPVGDTIVSLHSSTVYRTGGAAFNLGGGVEYRFSAGDMLLTDWSADSSTTITWQLTGVYGVIAWARPANPAYSDSIAYSDTLRVSVH